MRTPKPQIVFTTDGKKVPHEHKRYGRIEEKRKIEQFPIGRWGYVLLKWHGDIQIYEYLHVASSQKKAYKYLDDNFGTLKPILGLTEFNRIFQVKQIRIY